MARELFCMGMKKDIQTFVEACPVCQQNKYLALSAGLLQPLQNPKAIWDDLTMDFLEELPNYTILVVVDRLSKYAHFMTLKHPFTTRIVAELFIQGVLRLNGFPQSLLFRLQDTLFAVVLHTTHKLTSNQKY